MIRSLRFLLVFLALPILAWGQAAQVINGNRVHAGWVNYGTTGGTATAYTLTFTPALPGYVAGQCFLFKPHLTNTGAATLNVQGKGALPLTKRSGASFVPLLAGDLLLNHLFEACYDGTSLQLMGTAPDAGGVGVTDGDKGDLTVSVGGSVWTIDPGAITYSKLQPASAALRLFGRGSTGPGEWQEILLGANLAMTGTTLNASGASGVPDGDKTDITVSASGTVWTIDSGTVTYAKLQNVSTTTRLLGRQTAGAGPVEELPPASVKAMLGLTFGDLSGIATPAQLPNAAADTATKGIAAFQANDFNAATGVIALDYANAQAASSTTKGFLTSTDWNTFNAKQAALGYPAENSTNKNPSAVLGTSNTDYPTQNAVKLYVDSGVKALTNTALTPRICPAGPGSPITLNADNLTGCDVVQIADLSGPTTLDISGTPVNGQFLSLSIYTGTARAITWTSGAGKFSAEQGLALPTITTAAGYELWGFRYNSQSGQWAFVATPRGAGPGGSGSSDGTLHAADYGVVCDGTTNTTVAMQAALTAAKLGFQGRVLAMPLPTGDCVITNTLLLSEVINFALRGNGVTFRWAGPPGIPLFLFQDVQHSTLGNFNVTASLALPLDVAFQFENGPGTSLISSANHLDHVRVECTNGGCNYGIRMALGAGDGNNEFHRFTFMSIANAQLACARIDHSQSKHHLFQDFNCSNNNIGDYIIQNIHGSFHCIRCTGGYSTIADFFINESFDQMVIESGDFEGSRGASWSLGDPRALPSP